VTPVRGTLDLGRPVTLTFDPIDLSRHAAEAVAFRRDSYVCSFGSDEAFGSDADYLAWLRERIASHPEGHVHVWDGVRLVGQMEMTVHRDREGIVSAYVNLFYLVPDLRGRGLGAVLHERFRAHMAQAAAQRARLSVSPTNTRAVAYYLKHGWRDLGPPPDDPRVRVMELDVPPG
jgi:GNAT superfamily N-acetyltransferase